MRRGWPVAVAVGAVLAPLACSRGRSGAKPLPALDAAALREVGNPAAPGSGEANLAVTPDGRILLSWIEPDGDGHALRFAALGDEGFGDARTIARGERWFVNFADFPGLRPRRPPRRDPGARAARRRLVPCALLGLPAPGARGRAAGVRVAGQLRAAPHPHGPAPHRTRSAPAGLVRH